MLTQPCCSEAGSTQVFIMSRAATFSGTFFSTIAKKQFEIQNVGDFTIYIDLAYVGNFLGEQWSSDVSSNPDTRQELIEAVLNSDKTDKTPGYEKAMFFSIQNFPAANVQRINATRLLITVPKFPDYQLPKYDKQESLVALDIPLASVFGARPVYQTLGQRSIEVVGVGELGNATVIIPTAGVLGVVNVSFITKHEVESDGKSGL